MLTTAARGWTRWARARKLETRDNRPLLAMDALSKSSVCLDLSSVSCGRPTLTENTRTVELNDPMKTVRSVTPLLNQRISQQFEIILEDSKEIQRNRIFQREKKEKTHNQSVKHLIDFIKQILNLLSDSNDVWELQNRKQSFFHNKWILNIGNRNQDPLDFRRMGTPYRQQLRTTLLDQPHPRPSARTSIWIDKSTWYLQGFLSGFETMGRLPVET